jgi:hypothetical protein
MVFILLTCYLVLTIGCNLGVGRVKVKKGQRNGIMAQELATIQHGTDPEHFDSTYP